MQTLSSLEIEQVAGAGAGLSHADILLSQSLSAAKPTDAAAFVVAAVTALAGLMQVPEPMSLEAAMAMARAR
jgi:hypothetical protein